MPDILQIENLNKNYGRINAVKNVSFVVHEKEVFGLIGPNGAGKSTTLRIVATILSPSSGDVKVSGFSVINQADKVRQIISYLPEEAGAYRNLSGRGYLGFMASLFSDDKHTRKEYVDFAVEVCGLKDRLRDKIKTYSKGMTRKLLLARAVMTKPHLAILDEPTSGLDVINAFEIRRIIKRLSAEGMSVLLSSHNMLEVEFLSDRVGIINRGALLESGTPAELKKKHGADNLEEVFVKVAM